MKTGAPTGTYGEIQGDFILGGGISWSFDAYYSQGTTTDSTNFESEPSNFLLYDFSGSSQGLDYQITPPQLFAGFKAGISNVAALLPSGDTPQCHE